MRCWVQHSAASQKWAHSVPLVGHRYLGLYSTEIEAAVAYDSESVRQRGAAAVTNFALAEYSHLLGMPSPGVLKSVYKCTVLHVLSACRFRLARLCHVHVFTSRQLPKVFHEFYDTDGYVVVILLYQLRACYYHQKLCRQPALWKKYRPDHCGGVLNAKP